MPGLIYEFDNHDEPYPWNILFSNDVSKVKKWIKEKFGNQKIEYVWDSEADKRPDVIKELISSYTQNHCWGRSPNLHKSVIVELFKHLSPTAKERYEEELQFGYRCQRNTHKSHPHIDPKHKYTMTNIGTLLKQIPENVAEEIRTKGRTSAIRNELMAAAWEDPFKVAKREGINLSHYRRGGTRRFRGKGKKTRRRRV